MIWIFDLDETLYNEADFVISGLRAVSVRIAEKNIYLQDKAFNLMLRELTSNGRGKVFQTLLTEIPIIEYSVPELLNIYRTHKATLKLYGDAQGLLNEIKNERKYLVTDGNRYTQRSKIAALRIENLFDGVFVTDEHGEGAPKPGTKCFEMIRAREDCRWDEMVYIGDDPNKDFISLKAKGALTVRVNRGRFQGYFLDTEHEADIMVEDLSNLKTTLPLR